MTSVLSGRLPCYIRLYRLLLILERLYHLLHTTHSVTVAYATTFHIVFITLHCGLMFATGNIIVQFGRYSSVVDTLVRVHLRTFFIVLCDHYDYPYEDVSIISNLPLVTLHVNKRQQAIHT